MLFDAGVPGSDLVYRNLRAAKGQTEKTIKDELEGLWAQYEPFADARFPEKFAQDPNSRFWEMYLTVELMNEGKRLRPRASLERRVREHGPDICIEESDRRIWIESVCPKTGASSSLDSVPDLVAISEGGVATVAPRREVELRISSALYEKKKTFEKYVQQNIVKPEDVCIIAVSGANFVEQSSSFGMPVAATTVYPVGPKYAVFSKDGNQIVASGYRESNFIERIGTEPIPRCAFLDNQFSSISGLIWSRRSIGNFCWYDQDFVLIHNFAAKNAFSEAWIPWHEEYVVSGNEDSVELSLLSPRTHVS